MTTTTLTLAAFLEARLGEDEAAALAASSAPWTALTFYPTRSAVTNETEIDGGVIVSTPRKDDADAAHIARHDPARVLAEVAAKRRTVQSCLPDYEDAMRSGDDTTSLAEEVLGHLAAAYSDHADYDTSWAVS